jgi:hypothetical protein
LLSEELAGAIATARCDPPRVYRGDLRTDLSAFLLVRDGRSAPAITEGHGGWVQWL